MRIHSDINIPPTPETGQAAKSNSQAASGIMSGALAADTSELSSGGANVLALAAAVKQLPEVRQEKVAALAQQVLGGSYSPPPEQSAAALMSFMMLPSAA
jgi:flagellar biosynthesis anti-sigma factor FlgM